MKISLVEMLKRIPTVTRSGKIKKTFKNQFFSVDYQVSQSGLQDTKAWTFFNAAGVSSLDDRLMKNMLFVLPILAGIAFASYQLYLDYNPRASDAEEDSNREVIGEIL